MKIFLSKQHYRNLFTRVSALFAVAFLVATTVNAQTLISPTAWNGTGASAPGASTFISLPASTSPTATSVNISEWNRDGVAYGSAGATYNSNNWLIGGTLSTAIGVGSDVYFTVTNNATTELHITQLFIASQVSATGPELVQMECTIGSVTSAFGSLIGTAHSASPENWTFSGSICLGAGQTATFRLYGWSATGSTGTLRINNGTSITAYYANALAATASSNSPICGGSTPLNFTGTVSGGAATYTYNWSGPSFSSTAINPSIPVPTTSASGVYTFTVTDALTCTASDTTSVTVSTGPGPITGSTSVCIGTTSILGNAVTGGTWSSSDTTIVNVASATGVATGVSLGTATITYSLSAGCTSTIVVTVNPVPSTISGTEVVCVNATTTLTNTATSGTWSSADVSIATVNATTGVVTGVVGGTTTISYTLASGCVMTAIITVNPLPQAINGGLIACVGLTTTLSDASGAGTWASSVDTIATIDGSGVVMGISGGTSKITFTLTSTGCFSTATVTINPLPAAIGGSSSICFGSSVTLSDTSPLGTWSSNNTGVASIDASTGIATGASIGTAIITYTLPTGCIITKEVTVNALPSSITGTMIVCAGLTTTLSDATPDGTWSSGNTTIAVVGLTSGIVTGAGEGTTTITYIAPTGCIATAVVTVNPSPAAIAGTLSVCAGFTTTLTDASAPGTWSSSNTGVATIGASSGIVTGISAGNTTITFTINTGCFITATFTVNPLPAVIAGSSTVCVGSVTTLTDAAGSGTWSSSNTTVATIGAGTGIVTGGSFGVTTITYTLPTGCTATKSVTVDPIPAAITGASGVCQGTTITLSDISGTGSWSSSNSSIASVGTSTGIVTGVALGAATISYSLSTGCFVTKAIIVNPLPSTITGPSVVCAGGATITLSDSPFGGTWSSSNFSIATAGLGTGIVTGVTAGTATITYTLSTGCTRTSTITVNPLPASAIIPLGDTTFCPGGFVMLTANTGSGLTYQWYADGVFISGSVISTYLANTGGSYQVKEMNTFGCSAFSVPMLITVDTPHASIAIVGGGGPVFCAGSPVTFNANVGVGLTYQWLLDSVAIAGAVSNSYSTLTGGNYSVIVSNSTGCSDTSAVIPIVINPSPSATLSLSGPLTFCQNDSVVMSVDAPIAGYNYQWYSLGGAITGATNSSYTAITPDNYWVVVGNTYGCTATSVINVVVVNPLPSTAILPSGPLVFCTGGNVVLNASAATGLSYQWYADGVVIPGATNASYAATTSGGYRVQVTDNTTGCTDKTYADTIVSVISAPAIIPLTPTTFCWGGSSLLSTTASAAAGAVMYQWFLSGTAIPGATNNLYSAAVPGDYSCKITIPFSCALTTLAITVKENPLPNPVITFDGVSLHTGNFYTSYQWYKNLVAVAGATSSGMVATGNANYKVAVTDTNGCQSFSDVYVLAEPGAATGVAGVVNSADIKTYPNPASNMVYIAAPVKVRATITGLEGKLLMDVANANEMNISELPNGVYLITLYDESGARIYMQKLVKQ